jgi:Fe-S-cluster-containing dehydrogenase component
VNACPWEALEMQENNMLKRYTMRCTSCKSCADACPFGTIYPETIPYLVFTCDFCLGRLKPEELPACLEACTRGAIRYGEFEENREGHIYKISEHVVAKSEYKWEREAEASAKK